MRYGTARSAASQQEQEDNADEAGGPSEATVAAISAVAGVAAVGSAAALIYKLAARLRDYRRDARYPYVNEPRHEKICLMTYANNTDADQRSLISNFVRCLDSIIPVHSCYVRNFKTLASLCS